MTQKSDTVFRGYLTLSDVEKAELLKEITEHLSKVKNQQFLKESEVRRLGPTNVLGGCPCCGK